MVQLLLLGEEVVRDLDDWIVVPETVRVLVQAELVRNEALKVVLHVEYELLLQKRLLQQNCFDVENVD